MREQYDFDYNIYIPLGVKPEEHLQPIEIMTDEDLKNLQSYFAKSCNHEWKLYEGLTEKYNFCVYCDKKSEDGA